MLGPLTHHLGLSVSRDLIAAAYRSRQNVWTDVASRQPDEPLSDSIARLLARHPVQNRFHRDAVALLSTDHVRIRDIAGLPSSLTARDVELLLNTNWSRFFVSPFTESAVSTVQSSAGGWRAALADRSIVRAIFDGCSQAGWHLSAIIADPHGFDRSRDGGVDVSAVDVDGRTDLERERAVAISSYKRRTLVEIVPAEVMAIKRLAHTARIRIAASVCIAALVTAWTGPRLRSALTLRAESDRIASMSDRTATLQSRLDSITRITNALESVHQQNMRAASVIALLADLQTVLSDDAVIQQLRIDSTATEIAISADVVSETVRRIALKYPDIEMVGMVTTDGSPPTERALLRIAHARTHPQKRSRGAW